MMTISCDHKDIWFMESEGTRLLVRYDWSEAPDASPAGMCVFFYSTDNEGEYHRFDFSNIRGGEVQLPIGNYRIITYNNDTEAVQFSGQRSYDGHMAYTRTGDLLEPLYGNGITSSATQLNDERVVITPDNLWGCTATDVEISPYGVTYTFTDFWHGTTIKTRGTVTVDSVTGNQIITLKPADLLCHYDFEVRNVKNIEHISRISASLSGMSGAMNMSTGKLDTEHTTLPFSAGVNAAGDKVTGAFLTFGHCDTDTVAHRMAFFVEMDDGSKYSITDGANLDVTQQVDTAADRRHVHIVIDRLDLPSTSKDDAGMRPSVDDWGVKEEDLKI